MAQYDGDTIRKVSGRCLHLFAQSIDNARSLNHPGTDEQTQSALEDEFVRFKLWQSNIGVFASVHASLDFRLREIPDIAELFLRQLDTIEERLDQVSQMSSYPKHANDAENCQHERPHQSPECGRAFALPSATPRHLEAAKAISHTEDTGARGFELDPEESFDSWSQPELLHSIHESIDWLHRLSNMVRKASFNHQNKRAADFMLRDENGEKSQKLTHSLLDGLTRLYQFYVRTYASGVGEQLAHRLVQTMIIRHKRILYRRARRMAWSLEEIQHQSRNIAEKPRHSSALFPAQEATAPIEGKRPGASQPSANTAREVAGSQATATTIDISLIRQANAQSEVSKATSNSLFVSDRVLVPPRPAASKSGKEFVCDYCGLLLHANQASNTASWAEHVRKDLDPYVCVFDRCDTPLELYSSSRDWLSHMRSQHCMRWHCFATSHEPSFFESPGVLEKHLREIHAGHFTNEEIAFLIENSRHPSLSVIEHCPFCQETAENTEEHVARHLIQFALRSLPWPVDCCNSQHSSQSSRRVNSEGTDQSAETNRNEDGIPDVRNTDWDAWEKEIQAEGSDDDFRSPSYAAAEDKLSEPLRRRRNPDAVREPPTETQLSERQASLANLMKEEAAFVRDLQVLTDIYEATFKACTNFDQTTADSLFRNSGQLAALHMDFLKDLETAVSSELKDTQIPVSLFLENFHRLRPEHEAYSISHEDAMSLWQSIKDEPLVRGWINKCNETGSGLTNRKFEDLLALSNKQHRSQYYATWLNRLATQTPDNHPDKEPLLGAVEYHRDSVFRTETIQRRDKVVQRVLASGDSGGRRLSEVAESQDYTKHNSQDDADFTELCKIFHNDGSTLDALIRDLQNYCGHVNDYCDKILVLPNSLELFMSCQPGPYSEIESKWTNFALSFRRSLKEDLAAESDIGRISEEKLLRPIRNLIPMLSKALLLIDHRNHRRRHFEEFKMLKRSGNSPDNELARISEEFEAIDSLLRQELPKLHQLVTKLIIRLTEKLAEAQMQSFSSWRTLLQRVSGIADIGEWADIEADFQREFRSAQVPEKVERLGIMGSSQSRGRDIKTERIPVAPQSESPPKW